MNETTNTGTILAENLYLTLDTKESHLNNNVMIVGSSGRGKTRNVIKPNIMQMNSNYVISDPKGILIQELGSMLEEHGYKIKLLNLVEMEQSDTYNPLLYIKSHSDVYKLVEFLMANLTPFGWNKADPFWDQAAKALLSAIIFYLRAECEPEDQNFTSVMKLLRCIDAGEYAEPQDSTLDILMKDLQEKEPDHLAVNQYAIFKSVGGGKTAQSILISTAVYLQHFNLPEYSRLTSTDTLELEKITQEKTALFVVTSDTDRSRNWMAGIFYSQLFDILCRQENLIHTRFILDDFVCTGKIPDFDYKLAMIRSRNLSAMVVIQDEAQLEKEYGSAANGIISNCESYIFLGSSNIFACDMAARRLCKYGYQDTDIRNMSLQKCVVIYGNQGGIYEKYRIEKHPRYVEIADTPDSPRLYSFKIRIKDSLFDPLYISTNKKSLYRKELHTDIQPTTSKKKTFFDSLEEEYMYKILQNISNLHVFPHQHLKDVFTSTDTVLSKKLSMMHCDFIIRDEEMNPMFGIEIDGSQHVWDNKQLKNDITKNTLFAGHSIPLLRITAEEVRTNTTEVIEKILDYAKQTDSTKKYILQKDILPYNAFFTYKNLPNT